MKQTRIIMGMPITIEIVDEKTSDKIFSEIFAYFIYIDNKFSTYKKNSEIAKINNGKLNKDKYSQDMKTVLKLCEQTKEETKGYFDILNNGMLDPSGLVKGWAIQNAYLLLKQKSFRNFYIEAGGDIQVYGKNKDKKPWTVGIRNPFNREEIVKSLRIEDKGVATSGTYIRGQHIYNPHQKGKKITQIVSLTVIGPNIYEADRLATAAFAMGKKGILFIESMRGFEGYMIDKNGIATYTSGFERFVL